MGTRLAHGVAVNAASNISGGGNNNDKLSGTLLSGVVAVTVMAAAESGKVSGKILLSDPYSPALGKDKSVGCNRDFENVDVDNSAFPTPSALTPAGSYPILPDPTGVHTVFNKVSTTAGAFCCSRYSSMSACLKFDLM